MMQNPLQFYDPDLDFYFIVKVTVSGETFYAYNYRTLVRSIHSARTFDTRRAARRCIRQGRFPDSEMIKVPRLYGRAETGKTAD